MLKIPVTVVVPVKNEEKNLPDCLAPLKEFDQVLVVDSGSTDCTANIVESFGYEFIRFNWNGQFPKKRNWVLRNQLIKHEWVLFLDADEILTPEFIQELRKNIKASDVNGYWITYQNHFMGRPLNYGDKMRKLPLFRVGMGAYEKIEEDSWSHLDMEVHEHPIVEGVTAHFKASIIHNDYKGLEHYIARHNAYSSWEANRYLNLDNSNLSFRQKVKYGLMNTGLLPILYFIGAFVMKLGFLDGRAGLYLALYKAQYFFQIQTKIKELQS